MRTGVYKLSRKSQFPSCECFRDVYGRIVTGRGCLDLNTECISVRLATSHNPPPHPFIIATHADVLQVQASPEHLGRRDEAVIVVGEAGG